MQINIFEGILIPFVGTTLGAACVFFMRKTLSKLLQRALAGLYRLFRQLLGSGLVYCFYSHLII